MAMCVSVVIDDIIAKIDKTYDYCVPTHLQEYVKVGMRVIVPFSKGNIEKKALIIKVFDSDATEKLKQIISISNKTVILNDMQMSLLELLKTKYYITYHKSYKTIIPRGVDFVIKKKYTILHDLESYNKDLSTYIKRHRGLVNINELPTNLVSVFKDALSLGYIAEVITAEKATKELTERYLTLKINKDELDNYISQIDKRFQKQIDLLSVFYDYAEISEREALYYSGCSHSTVETLNRKGIIEFIDKTIERNPYKDLKRSIDTSKINLSDDQSSVCKSIISEAGKFKVHLINGVTGSGKTMVYMALIDSVIKKGKSVIFMVPEISLTPQTLSKFYSRYGDKVAVIHSGLSVGERADEWRKIKNTDCTITVGTRSAVFSPANNLGMIIIDEEHESCYKSESAPRFHARDISKYICSKLNIPLVLGSATPSIESAYFAKRGIYNDLRLVHRYNNNPLPETEIIDMRESIKEGNQSFLSSQLKEALKNTLDRHEQAILFLNRRGAHSMVGCRSCGYVIKCPNCAVSLTYHSANNRCMCHYCGYSIKMFDKCPSCSSKHIKMLGFGTQLVYTELTDIFSKSKILRMDFDSINSYISYGNNLNAFKNGEYDIMLGTQMVAKGLDFPNVTLVGVLNADLSLYIDDFRANERTFSLLTQVCGRSGRADKPGKAYIQTYSPDYEVIKYAKEQNYDKYYQFEIDFRKAMNYPPFCDIILFTISNQNDKSACDDAKKIYEIINQLSKSDYADIPVRLLHPTTPKILKFNNKFRYNITVKTRMSKRMYDCLDKIISEYKNYINSDVCININPINNI